MAYAKSARCDATPGESVISGLNMSLSGKSEGSPSLILAIAVFACTGFCIYRAKDFASAAPNEETTTAHVVSVEHQIFRYLRFNFYSCGYNFSLDGALYLENGDCPQGIADDAAKGKYSTFVGASTETNVTVYYDPSDPSVNSLLEFRAASESYYRQAASLTCVGTLIIVIFVFAKLLAANEKRGKGGVVVDASGTVICPEEIGVSTGLGGLPPRDRNAENSTANGEALNFGAFTSSSELRELYLKVANQIHPDRAANERDLALRERLMKEANAAFERGDADTLRRVLEEYRSVTPAS